MIRIEPIDEHVAPADFASWPQSKKDQWFAAANRDILAAKRATAPSPRRQHDDGEDERRAYAPPASKVAGVATVAEAPRPLRREASPAEPFPVNALGEVLGGAAHAIADKIMCPASMAGSSVLAVASLAAQLHADVTLPVPGSVRPLSLFLVSVAGTGERKSAANGEAMRPVRRHEARLREHYDEAVIDHRRAKRAFDVAIANAEKTKGDRHEIKLAIGAVGEEPPAPLLPILTTDEPTIEGLHKLFEKGQPSLGLFSDEGGSFLGGHALANENRLRSMAALSNMWDGESIRRIRAGDGASILLGRRLALHIMSQPEASARLLSDPMAADQGLLSRLLVCAPASKAGTRLQKALAPETEPALRRYGLQISDLLAKPFTTMPGARNALDPRALVFEAAAAARFVRLCDLVERRLGAGGELEAVRGFANKLPEHIGRIAGVLALVDDSDAREITADVFDRAAIIGEFYTSEAKRLFEAGAGSPEIRDAERLLAWIKTHWQESLIGLRAIYRQGPNSIRDAATAKKAVAMLEDHGWLIRVDGAGHIVDGQPVREAWRIVREA